MFGSWVPNEIWIIDLSSALVGTLLSSSKLFPLSKEVIVIGTALCYSHQVCCLLYYLDKINSGIHMYQFTFKPLHFCLRMCLWFRIWTKILADRRIWRKKGTDRRICIPLFTPLYDYVQTDLDSTQSYYHYKINVVQSRHYSKKTW